jgi:hypothetical protein
MVYEDVVLTPENSDFFDFGITINLDNQYFIPAYAALAAFKVHWKEKAENSFTKLALREIRKRNEMNPKGIIKEEFDGRNVIYKNVGFPYFATYDSKRNKLTSYFMVGFQPEDMVVTFQTYKDELVDVPFGVIRFDYEDGDCVRYHLSNSLDLRYMIAKTVTLTQKKVLSISCG